MDKSMRQGKIDYNKAPAFEVLFHLGKKTMRPGGMELTCKMLEDLRINERDKVVELAPGRGVTTRMVLELLPKSYTAVERNRILQQNVQEILYNGDLGQCVVGTAQATGLNNGCASVVFGEAMLTMQTMAMKREIVKEAFHLLAPGGQYGIHETYLKENLSSEVKTKIKSDLRDVLHVAAQPLALKEWRQLLEEAGFSVRKIHQAPMLLLEPRRMIHDEGLWGSLRFVFRVITSASARRRIKRIRQTFKHYGDHLNAAVFIAVKPE